MERNHQLVCIQALWEAGNNFSEGSDLRRLYHAISELIESELEPEEGEVDEAMAVLSAQLKAIA
jgi:hypothetical protein